MNEMNTATATATATATTTTTARLLLRRLLLLLVLLLQLLLLLLLLLLLHYEAQIRNPPKSVLHWVPRARVRARGALQLPPIPHPFCVTVLSNMSPKFKPWSKLGQHAQRQLLQDLTALMVPHCETATDVSQLLHALGERVRRSNQSVGPSNSASKLAIILDSPTNDFSIF